MNAKRIAWLVLGVMTLPVGLAACSVPVDDGDETGPSLAGEWTACVPQGGGYCKEVLSFGGGTLSVTMTGHAAGDSTCSVLLNTLNIPSNYQTGGKVTATLGSETVKAFELDMWSDFTDPEFTISYIDFDGVPEVL